MTHTSQETITRLLGELRKGNREAFDDLFPLVYDALRELAHRQRQRWQGDETLNTTALVHEAYLKLVDQSRAEWETRAHFFAAAAKAMRHILTNYARSKRTQKRGGGRLKLSLDEMKVVPGEDVVLTHERAEMIVALGEALEQLEQVSERQSRIVECRYFGGMTIPETATALGVSTATVSRGWALAQVWLYRQMKQALGL